MREVDGHTLLARDFTFESTLLGPKSQAELADARLTGPGAAIEEAFVLPIDPEHLLERTGFACMNESDFPPNSVDTENARQFYDDTCEGEVTVEEDGCHLTAPIPTESCPEAVRARVGAVETQMRFERLAWDAALADRVRVGRQLPGVIALRAMPEGVADHRIVYRYFPENSCAISEGCVGGAGWRRLLQFTATVQNLGALDSAIGDVGPGSGPVENNVVSFSACHGHMHFNHYGRFSFGSEAQQLGGKRAFCLESTWRYFNNEDTPFTHPYSCHFQGTAAGWGDDYIAGLDCQWVDITAVDTRAAAVTDTLSFHVNPDEFLCEGTPRKTPNGDQLYEPTEFLSEAGVRESKLACFPSEGAAEDNVASAQVTLPAGPEAMVTEPCARGQLGPMRNCGFARRGAVLSCTPGQPVRLVCSGASPARPVAVRVCEASARLGAIPCTFNEALGRTIVSTGEARVELTCPAARSAELGENGGGIGVFVAPILESDPAEVDCRFE